MVEAEELMGCFLFYLIRSRLFGALHVDTPSSVRKCICSLVTRVIVARRASSWCQGFSIGQVAGLVTLFLMRTRSPFLSPLTVRSQSSAVVALVTVSTIVLLAFAASSCLTMASARILSVCHSAIRALMSSSSFI